MSCTPSFVFIICPFLSLCRVGAVSLIVSDLLLKKCVSFSYEIYCWLHLVVQVFTTYYWFSMLHLLMISRFTVV